MATTLQTLADEWELSKYLVRKRLSILGLAPRRGRPLTMGPKETAALVEQARREGWTQNEAAAAAGVHPQTVKKALKRYGIAWWR